MTIKFLRSKVISKLEKRKIHEIIIFQHLLEIITKKMIFFLIVILSINNKIKYKIMTILKIIILVY